MALLGHVTPEMTLRYAKLANPTIRAAYQAAIAKTRVGAALPIATINRTPVVADRVAWLRAEMLKTRLAHGTCTRDPAAGVCPYANICEQCDNFAPAADAAPILRAQLADAPRAARRRRRTRLDRRRRPPRPRHRQPRRPPPTPTPHHLTPADTLTSPTGPVNAHEVGATALPGRAVEHGRDRLLQAQVGVGHHEADPAS